MGGFLYLSAQGTAWYLLHMATRPQNKKIASPLPYLLHFGMFVGAFFAIIGGALFVLNIAGAIGG